MIGIFRTNITSVHDKNNVIKAISSSFEVQACSVDIEDCDRVLRVAGQAPFQEEEIIELVTNLGFACDILD
ncbi:hypothetical protein [Chitinophaga sp. sic0106]|uniref:hypothetical protein n=1 Tax=Chitinophaga sp. sic0106 TaxID=2854785 RepID=UPI001C475AF4|nr:hypothetical protein [Chitinophaga sp. sic0106]MBV7529379.1 hypothetical protein [Chitinophaga sp. sic0106]